jgi:hypothetical protein
MKGWIVIAHIGILIIILANSTGRAIRGQGNTGAPGDGRRVCQSCHNSAELQVMVQVSVFNLTGDSISMYEPGGVYRVKVQIDSVVGQPLGYGMQMVSITDNLFQNTGIWDSVSFPLNVIYNANTDRSYAEHFMISDTNIFEAIWIAPDSLVGPISFYAAGNGVNRNGSSSGDGGGADKVTIFPASTTGNFEYDQEPFKVYPNPSNGLINLSKTGFNARIINSTGRVVRKIESTTSSINLSDLPAGVYVLQISDRKNQWIYSKKVLKI